MPLPIFKIFKNNTLMKKTILAASVVTTFAGTAQTFSDNFDSYTAGSYLAAQSAGAWTTWSNMPGTSEDVLVSSADAVSGPNSLYFATTSEDGGPTDLVKNFGVQNTGQFSLEFNLKVQAGKAGYFNLQKTATIGEEWAMDCYFEDNGIMTISNQSGLNFTAPYTQGQWINFRLDINFNTNHWEVFFNGISAGSFSNPENQIASIDVYPTDQNAPYSCGFFIDNFEYTVTPYTLPAVNAAVTLVSFDEGALAGAAVTPKVKVRNMGSSVVNSFDVAVAYNGATISQSVLGLSLPSLAETTITLTGTQTLIAGPNNMLATVSNVNGTATDGDPSDNTGSITVDPIVPALGKKVVGEEATGTWCQWCPRGAVFMDRMETKYPEHWVGIAVHNDDPMVVPAYDTPIGPLIAGYPSALVDRGDDVDPSEMEPDFLDRILVAPKALITNGATWNAATRELNVSVSAEFLASATNAYRLAIVLTEDEVTGITSGYSQANAYAGGAAGPMGGYESLPSVVPAAQMVYDHVARAIQPGFTGYGNSFPAVVNTGETHTITTSFVLPAAWDETRMHIIGLLIAPNGRIDNAGEASITDAVGNGFVPGAVVTASIEEDQIDAALIIYPNPASTSAVIAVNLSKESTVSMRILDISGKEVAARDYGYLNGSSTITVNTANYVRGVYIVEMKLDNTIVQRRLVVE